MLWSQIGRTKAGLRVVEPPIFTEEENDREERTKRPSPQAPLPLLANAEEVMAVINNVDTISTFLVVILVVWWVGIS